MKICIVNLAAEKNKLLKDLRFVNKEQVYCVLITLSVKYVWFFQVTIEHYPKNEVLER